MMEDHQTRDMPLLHLSPMTTASYKTAYDPDKKLGIPTAISSAFTHVPGGYCHIQLLQKLHHPFLRAAVWDLPTIVCTISGKIGQNTITLSYDLTTKL